jgi:hypothetical protein
MFYSSFVRTLGRARARAYGSLYENYEAWAKKNNIRQPMSKFSPAWGAALRTLGCTPESPSSRT